MQNRFLIITVIILISFLTSCSTKEDTNTNVDSKIEQEITTEQKEANKNEELNEKLDEVLIETEGLLNPLTGKTMEKSIPLTAIMLGNNPGARPQTGLLEADVVYEVEAEGMITRYMALFHGDPPDIAGPVRSARPYFLMLAKEWDAYYVHVGGSTEAYKRLPEWQIANIDDMRGAKGFVLDASRKRPNKTYFNFETGLSNKSDRGRLSRWEFTDFEAGPPEVTKLSLKYGKGYRVNWLWDEELKAYQRYLGDKPYLDRAGTAVAAQNIIVQYVEHQATNSDLGHIKVNFIGQGKAEYFLGGQYYQGGWKKENLEAATKFSLEDGRPIELSPGNTWIQVQRTDKETAKEMEEN